MSEPRIEDGIWYDALEVTVSIPGEPGSPRPAGGTRQATYEKTRVCFRGNWLDLAADGEGVTVLPAHAVLRISGLTVPERKPFASYGG